MHFINTVIFDMDGLLIDSEPFWRLAEIKVFATVGLQLTNEDCRKTIGYRFDEVVDYWYKRHPWEGKSKLHIMHEVIEEVEQAILNLAEPMRGAVACIHFCKDQGLKTAIASSSSTKLIKASAKRLGVENEIDQIVSAELFLYGKPHPQVFIETAHLLGVHRDDCIVLEDSLNGILAAKSAKMQCIAIPDLENKNNSKYIIADEICDSLIEAIPLIENRIRK